jgi:hypothetical protein
MQQHASTGAVIELLERRLGSIWLVTTIHIT